MRKEALRLEHDPGIFMGYLLLDEMSVQQDLQIKKQGQDWHIVGAVDLGPIVNNLDDFISAKPLKLATHCLQYLYVGVSGFKWPVCYYATDNVNGHSIYFTIWTIISKLQSYGFQVIAALMDGSSNNRQFMRIVVNEANPRMDKFTTVNPFDFKSKLVLVQDIKHCFKKIRNSILSSGTDSNAVRTLKWNGHFILWEHFECAYLFNSRSSLRIYRNLSKDHIYINAQGKMRNFLATNVLNKDMLHLMKCVQSEMDDKSELEGTISLLEATSELVDIFLNIHSTVANVYDAKIGRIVKVLEFFHSWEGQFNNPKEKRKHLLTCETREDIDCSLYGFIETVKICSAVHIPVNPGYFNSDLIENWFCCQRGLRNGFAQNPTIAQIGPGNNANILTGSVISAKSNAGKSACKRLAVQLAPLTKKKPKL